MNKQHKSSVNSSSIQTEELIKNTPRIQADRSSINRLVTPLNSFEKFTVDEIEQSVSSRFEKQADKYPDSIAVKDRSMQFTYLELNQFANQLARSIIAKIGTQEEPIILFLEQGAVFLAAIFGALKAGKCYVPVDPSFPEVRNSYILENSQAKLIVTNDVNFLAAQSLASDKYQVLNIDTIDSSTSIENLDLQVSPDALAYIIYTSGSTGKPKGVVQNHRNLLHNCMNQTNAFHLGVGDRMPLVHSCSVMGAVRVIYNALLNGVSLYPLDVKAEGLNALRNLLTDEKITVFHSVATLFRHFADIFSDADQFPDLRLVILGGEAMSRKDVELYKKQFPDNCLLCTGLGSTEAGTIRVFMLDKQTEIETSLVPPGYAVDDMEVLLLDEEGKEVEHGCVGEIVIRSPYLVLGYWHRPDLTEAAFLPDPEGGQRRIFRTGDMGYFLPDGCLVHAGRKDFQVKIRGNTVNISEIEMALLDYGFIKEAVVIGRENELGEMSLFAYIVPRQQPGPTASELRNFIAQRLPSYMIPSRFITLDALPQTANGKVNRLAFPEPERIAPEVINEFIAPRSPIEQMVADVWTNVLQLQKVGIHDNFLDIGGNSLLGMQIISRLRDTFQVNLSPQILFEAPTVADLADQVIQQNSEVLNHRDTAVSLAKDAAAIVVPHRDRNKPTPLSFSQQRLWVFEQLNPNTSTYVVSKALRLTGIINLDAIQKTLDAIVDRHEILRTNFLSGDGEPIQIVRPFRSVDLPIIDLSEYLPEAQEKELQRILQEEDQRPFSLDSDLMLRVTLVRLAEQEHLLILVRHHLASDGWSLGIIWQEMSALYTGFTTEQPSSLPELPVQFADFAAWEREWLTGEVLEAQLNYWKQALTGSPALLQLPTDRPRPPVQTFNGQTESFHLSQELSERLQVLSRKLKATLYMTLLTTFVTLLARYSGQRDVAVGSMVANRNLRELEPLIGFFSNLLVLRTQIDDNPTFLELLHQVRHTSLEAFTHKDVPFEHLTTALKPERSPSHTPWFQVLFMLQNFSVEYPELPGLTVNPVVIEESAKFDLTLTLTETASGLVASLAYNTDLFDQSTIHRMIGHFQTLLETFSGNPEQRVFNAPMLTIPERHQLLEEWNRTEDNYPQQRCIHQLFEAQVEQTPDAVAVVFEDRQLTYQELNTRANQLAHHLQFLGVRSDVLVGICVERSLEMLVGMLAVLKAGGAYVPLDPAYPQDRIAYVLEDAQVPVLLTQSSLIPNLPTLEAQVICLDDNEQSWRTQSSDNLPNLATQANLAYVIYTSGSTGKPKGVQIVHGAVVNFLASMCNQPGICSEDVLLAVTTLSFDIAVLELFAPLTVGARVAIASRETAADAYQLAIELNRSKATILQATPATWRMLLDSGWQGCMGLKMLCGGEELTRELANQLLQKGDSLWNMYGPTETTVWSAVSQVEYSEAPVYVGHPISNTQFFILDDQKQPVPIGVPGELYIGGAGLARGYLNRNDLTAERFIPNPFATELDSYLYRTGDRVRYLRDGVLEFLGRVDYQVKIRGFRIELGEIESALRKNESISQCVVIDREDTPGDKRLVAYIVYSENSQAIAKELREFLQQTLPDYMIPSAFIQMESLPLTPNGKVDRRALPKPEASDLQTSNFVSPRTSAELRLADIWMSVLGVQQVGIHDNFFELGGHSLLAVRLIAQIEKNFGKNLPLSVLLLAPTIEQLADRLLQSDHSELWTPIIPIQPNGSKPPLFCIHGAGFNVLVYRDLSINLGPDYPVYGVQARGLDGQISNLNNIGEIVSDYLHEIRRAQPEGPYFLAGLSKGGNLALEIAQQLRAQGQTVALIAMFDSHGPEAMKLLPPLPRFLNSLYYLLRYSIPRSIEKGGLRVIPTELQKTIKILSRESDLTNLPSSPSNSVMQGVDSAHAPLPKTSFLETWMERVSQYVIERSPWSYKNPLAQLGKMDDTVSSTLKKLQESHRSLNEGYNPQPYAGKVTLFRAQEPPPGYKLDPNLGWGTIAQGGVEVYSIPGHHSILTASPLLGRKLRDCIDQAIRESTYG
jgi:amino acid adenylation domain-containing protein